MLLLAYLCLFSPALTVVQADCPNSLWKEWKSHCYRLTSPPVSWHGIRGECKTPYRADVASIASKAEQDFIRNKISFKQSVWLGMRSHEERRWWVDGSRVSFTNFTQQSETKGSNDVVKMVGDSGAWQLVSSYAGIKLRGVCKLPSCRCPSGWKKWRSSCYKAVKKQVSWLEAQGLCQSMAPAANLVTIDTARENAFVFKLATRVVTGSRRWGVWIGLNDRENENEFRWIAEPKADIFYTNWSPPADPNGHGHLEDCGLMIKEGLWYDVRCKVPYLRSGFVCEQQMCGKFEPIPREPVRRGKLRVWRPEDGVRCPDGWSRSGNKCFSTPTAPDTFGRVQRLCGRKHLEAQVAVVSSLEDNDGAFHRANTLPMWIAYDISFVNWAQGAGDDSVVGEGSEAQLCTSMQESGQWLHEPCAKERPGLCQLSACKPSCPAGWQPFEGNCYRMNHNKQTWDEAEASCQRDGGQLASILTQEENDFITFFAFQPRENKPVDREAFIGGTRTNDTSFWSWSDCSRWTISRWGSKDGNHPSFTTGTRAALRNTGRWFGVDHLKGRYKSVCKLDPCHEQFGPLSRSGCKNDESATTTAPVTEDIDTCGSSIPNVTTAAYQTFAARNQQVQCPNGMSWMIKNRICISNSISPPSGFVKASYACKNINAADFNVSLPIIRLPDLKSELLKLANGRDVWVGAGGHGMFFWKTWKWHDGVKMTKETEWQKKPEWTTNCAAMDGKTGGLVARSCQDKLRFFCAARRLK